jgi:pentatricopeptide repeat protein
MEERLHGARAAESARKIMEEMVGQGFEIRTDAANNCLRNCLGDGLNGSHQGFGGIDTALAMIAAMEQAENPPSINLETYSKLITALAVEGSLDDSLKILRDLVAEKFETPSLQLFAEVASSCFNRKDDLEDPEQVMTVLAYAKAAGYELNNIASIPAGRSLLAAGVIAAEKMDNLGLGLRFLVAASNAEGCEPDKGDILVANLSPVAQRAATIIHRKAIEKASQSDSWKLCVKLLELMLRRGLTPSPSTWRNVVTCCAKLEKSRKATSILLDWVSLVLPRGKR